MTEPEKPETSQLIRRPVRYNGPRLVVGGTSAKDEAPLGNRDQVQTIAVLRSAIADKTPIVLGVLTDLFGGGLRTGERIEFVHRISRPRDELGAGRGSYQLLVKIGCPIHRSAELSALVSEALVTAYPGYHMERVTDSSAVDTGPSLPYTAHFAPAGAIVAPKPAMAKYEEPTWQQSPALSSMLAAGQPKPEGWPYPGRLANWALTAPLYEPLELPDCLEVTVRIHGFALAEDACHALHKSLHRVLGGNLCVFHPASAVTEYSASAELADSAAALVRHWLRHPTAGYAVDCLLRSSDPLGTIAERRVASDVFGNDRPFECLRRFDDSSPLSLASPTLAWAITPDQGIPALMPGQALLTSLGIPAHYPAPVLPPPRTGARLGTTVCGRNSAAVHLPAGSRSRHVALVGSTGSGKSFLMSQMLIADITDPERRCGVALIDPHGTLFQQVLDRIPRDRVDDVVLMNVTDQSHTASLNPLEGMRDDPLHAQFITGEVLSLIEMLMERQDTTGPVTINNLRNLFLLAASINHRHCTFQDVYRILADPDYCDYVLAKCRDRNVVEYWERFKKTTGSEHGYGAWAPYLLSRLGPFVSSPIMQRVLNRPDSTIDLAQAMREKKIVLFNLSRGVLQDIECQVLGSLILTKFFSAAVRRSPREAEMAPMHLYVDEFQTLATDSTPRLYSEARKFNLCLTTANQSLGQLRNAWGRSNIADQVLANTATKFLFRLGPSDIEHLQPYFRPHFNHEQMANLPDFHAVACMSDENRPLPPFVLRTEMAESTEGPHVPAAEIIDLSRERYAIPIGHANRELMKIHNLSAESLGMTEADVEPLETDEKPTSVFAQLFNENLNS